MLVFVVFGSCAGNSPFGFMEQSKQEGHIVDYLPVCLTLLRIMSLIKLC